MSLQDCIRRADSILPGIPAPEGEEDPRWQAILEIENYVETNPEEIWPFVVRWGSHPQEDLRNAIATCLLEHLLEIHFELIFPRVREAAEADALFADTFCRCWKLGQAEAPSNSERFDALRSLCESRR
jgi:hypothetical protein